MNNKKAGRILCVLCWLCAAMCGVWTGYMLHFTRQFPEVESFVRSAWRAGGLTLLWLAAAVWFTVKARSGRKDRKK